jgi:hypothetical protein
MGEHRQRFETELTNCSGKANADGIFTTLSLLSLATGEQEEQVAVLQAAGAAMAAACVGADKERAALRQILESKVGGGVGVLLTR